LGRPVGFEALCLNQLKNCINSDALIARQPIMTQRAKLISSATVTNASQIRPARSIDHFDTNNLGHRSKVPAQTSGVAGLCAAASAKTAA
jgi:hypothetical protein